MVATGTVARHCTRGIPPFEPSTPIFAVPTNFLCRSNKTISGPPQLFCVLLWYIDGAPEFLADCDAGDAQRRLGPVIGLVIEAVRPMGVPSNRSWAAARIAPRASGTRLRRS